MKPRILIKLGGSLLDCESLQDLVNECVSEISKEKQPVFVIGGGAVADAVRQWDQIHNLGDKTAHDIALHSLTLTECMIEALIPKCERVVDIQSLKESEAKGNWPILAANNWLTNSREEFSIDLPENWTVTSDSIAAWLAASLNIEELLLLKSANYCDGTTLEEAVTKGSVDSYFPELIHKISTRKKFVIFWCNLRSSISLKQIKIN